MPDTPATRATRAARQALKTAIREDFDRMRFRIDKFGRHRDGYFHARIIVDNTTPVYVHCRYGSWQIPGHVEGKSVLKEPEAMLGSDLGRTVKFTLAEEARRFKTREEPPDEPAKEADDAEGDGPTVPEPGVPT